MPGSDEEEVEEDTHEFRVKLPEYGFLKVRVNFIADSS
jgi:hypothetical protein